eukprot:COSAG02_NODE_454_length_22024_cov_9.538518_3_plen_744_part_00
MNELLAQLRLEREGRRHGTGAPGQQERKLQPEPEHLQPEPEHLQPEPEHPQPEAQQLQPDPLVPQPDPEVPHHEPQPGKVLRESQRATLHEETAAPAPTRAAEVQREQRLQHLRSRRRSRRPSAGRHGADPPLPSLAGILGLVGSGEQDTGTPTGPAARRTPTPEELGFAPTLEATLSDRPVQTGEVDEEQRSLDREQRRPARRPRPTAAELGFSGDLAAVLNSTRPRQQLMPEPKPEPELEPLVNEPRTDAVPDRQSRLPSAASLGFHSESLEAVLQPMRIIEQHDGDEVLETTQDAASVGSIIHQDWPQHEPLAADAGIRSTPDSATNRPVDVHPGDSMGVRDEPNLVGPEHVNEDALQTPPGLSSDAQGVAQGVPAWSRASIDATSESSDTQQPQQQRPLSPRQPAVASMAVPTDREEENGGLYAGSGRPGILDQDRTPFRLGGAGTTARSGVSIPVLHGGMGSGQQYEGAASATGAQPQDAFLQAIEAASRPVEHPRQYPQQQERRRQTPAPSAVLMNQDHTPFPMGGARGGGLVDRSGSAVRPDEHAADWEALARRSRGEGQANPEDGTDLVRYRNANMGERGRADGLEAAVAQPPHPEWVMPRRQHPAPRPQPGRRRTSRANERARAEQTSEAARVALSSLLESSGEWTYEQLIALDDENESRAGLSYTTVRNFERRRCTDDEKADGEACAICLEPYCDADWLKRLPCEHCFHEDCILHWFKDHTLCPMCRFDCQCA